MAEIMNFDISCHLLSSNNISDLFAFYENCGRPDSFRRHYSIGEKSVQVHVDLKLRKSAINQA